MTPAEHNTVDDIEIACHLLDTMIPQLKAHHWIFRRVDELARRMQYGAFKKALETVIPYVDDIYGEEKFQAFKASPLRFISNFTDGSSLLEALLATREYNEPAEQLTNVRKRLEAAKARLVDSFETAA